MLLIFEEIDQTPNVQIYAIRGVKKGDADRGEVQIVDGYAYFTGSNGEEFTPLELLEVIKFMEEKELAPRKDSSNVKLQKKVIRKS